MVWMHINLVGTSRCCYAVTIFWSKFLDKFTSWGINFLNLSSQNVFQASVLRLSMPYAELDPKKIWKYCFGNYNIKPLGYIWNEIKCNWNLSNWIFSLTTVECVWFFDEMFFHFASLSTNKTEKNELTALWYLSMPCFKSFSNPVLTLKKS